MRKFGIALLAAAGALGVISVALPTRAPAGNVREDAATPASARAGDMRAGDKHAALMPLTPVSAVLPAPARQASDLRLPAAPISSGGVSVPFSSDGTSGVSAPDGVSGPLSSNGGSSTHPAGQLAARAAPAGRAAAPDAQRREGGEVLTRGGVVTLPGRVAASDTSKEGPEVLARSGAVSPALRAQVQSSYTAGARASVTPPPGSAASAAPVIAIVLQDQVSLRAAPRASAQLQAQLWAGEALEVRGEKLDYVQVWDHKRERGGFVHASYLYRGKVGPDDAPALLTLLRFLRDSPGSESLGIGLAAAYLEAADAQMLNSPAGAEAFDALGGFADRLARRASSDKAQDRQVAAVLSAHLDVAARYGINFATYEQESRMRLCYDGEAYRRVLALPATHEQRARAALGLTRLECANPDATPTARLRLDEWRADVLDRVDTAALPGYLRNRVLMRRAGVWSALAYERAHFAAPVAELGPALPGTPDAHKAEGAAARALSELAGVAKADLAYEDTAAYAEAAMRVSASRWAALPESTAQSTRGLVLRTVAGQPGETCVLLLDAAKPDEKNPLARRCTYGLVWTASASLNREANAMTLAVQTLASWRELWVLRKSAGSWSIDVLPPASSNPDVGYAEFAGWVPGGAQMLVAREARDPVEGKLRRAFEVIRLDTLATEREVAEPGMLSTFQRWQDANWKRMTLSLR